jgi:hypothetical protein
MATQGVMLHSHCQHKQILCRSSKLLIGTNFICSISFALEHSESTISVYQYLETPTSQVAVLRVVLGQIQPCRRLTPAINTVLETNY